MAFKVGQRVVYVGTETAPKFNLPQRHEIVTIDEVTEDYGLSYLVTEYKYMKGGIKMQVFMPNEMKPLDHSFADSIL